MGYRKALGFLALALVLAVLGFGQVKEKGEISGTVTDEEGAILPGVNITLTGASLFQKSLATTTDARGTFRFAFLNPGTYTVEIALQGFGALKYSSVLVSAGRTTPISAKMVASKLTSEVTVLAKVPLVETKTPQVSVNFDNFIIQNAPNSRNFIDIVNAAPAVNDNDAYGEAGNVSWGGGGVYLARGSMTSSFKINSVDVSNPAYGMTYVNPIYETIEEVQITSVGASAEYGDYVGASINIVTKSGSNTFHGALSANYTGNFLYSTKITEHPDYDYQIDWGYNSEFAGILSGPIVKEKLFFSAAGGYAGLKTRYKGGENWEYQYRPRAYGKLDYRLNNANTFSLMVNINPSQHKNYGLWGSSYAFSTAFTENLAMNSIYASWNSILSSKAYFYVKFAGYKDHIKWDPSTPGVPQYVDGMDYSAYGGAQLNRNVYSSRWSINAQASYYADEFLGMNHELKLGVEYDHAQAGEWREFNGGGYLYSIPYGEYTMWQAFTGGGQDNLGIIKTPRAYIQDNIKVNKHIYLNLGLRYEHPALSARFFTGNVTQFDVFSPRVGFSYDIAGDAQTVIRGSFGRYYNQVLTGTYYYCLPGNDDEYIYTLMLPTAVFDPTTQNIQSRLNQVAQPENLATVYTYGTPVPVDPKLKLNGTNVFSLGLSRQLGNSFAVEVNYIYKKGFNRYQIKSLAEHTYEPYEWTDPWLGHTITLYQQTDSNPDTNLLFANSTWQKTRHHFIEFILRKNPTQRWAMMFSYVFQDSKSNMSGLGSNDLFGFPDYNVDTDPYYYNNPFQWGRQWMHQHQFKLLTTYFGPWGINLSGDFHLMSGQPWAPEISAYYIPSADRPYRSIGGSSILLEQRGSHNSPMSAILNLRVGKVFKIRNSSLEFQFDVFNALNGEYYYRIITQPWRTYSDGSSAYGKPSSLFAPRNSRINIAWRF